MASPPDDECVGNTLTRKRVLFSFYIVLMYFALVHAPGSLTDLREVHKAVVPSPSGDPLFRALFSLLLAEGAGLFGLLCAGAPAQPYPFLVDLFGVLGMFLGFYGGGAYIALREYAPRVDRPPDSPLARLMGTRIVGAAVLAYSLQCYAGALPLRSGVVDSFANLWRLMGKDRYVWASAVDIVILMVVAYGLLEEDMQRRGLGLSGSRAVVRRALAVAVLAVPGVGLGVYMLLRPRIRFSVKKRAE